MGADISGWVEFRDAALDKHFDEEEWYSVIDAGTILDRNYSMFGSLFGVRNGTDFAPVAAGRGLPPGVSDAVRERAEVEDFYHSHTWVTWSELQAVDWDEEGLDGIAWGRPVAESRVRHGRHLAHDDPHRRDGAAWIEDGLEFNVMRVTRRRAAGDDFHLLMEMMEPLARRVGGDNVRLVVWFDN